MSSYTKSTTEQVAEAALSRYEQELLEIQKLRSE